MKSADLIAEEIIRYHGEVSFSPGELLTLARGLAERNLIIKQQNDELELAGDRSMGEDL